MCKLQCFVFVVLIQCTISIDLISTDLINTDLISTHFRYISDGSGFKVSFECDSTYVWPLKPLTVNDLKIKASVHLELMRCELPEEGKIGDIAEGIIADNIKTLTMQSTHNLTWTLSREKLAEFKNLEVLELPKNKLKNVTTDLLYDLKKLEILNLEENDLRKLPTGFLNLDNLLFLHLQSNKLEVIGPKIFEKLENLHWLFLQDNKLVEIEPHSFDNLKSLTLLNMEINNLQTLPENIFAELENLEDINLSQNNFSNNSLSERLFKNNKLLRNVHLSKNQQNLTTLPSKFFANLTRLTWVEICQNNIVHLPEDLFDRSVELKYLHMMSNDIQELSRHIFKGLKELLFIKLSSNKLRELPNGVFSKLHKLKDLDLSNNYITTLNENIFRDLTSLEVLNMERNGLKTIHDNVFEYLEQLRIARLSFNQLTLKTNQSEKSPTNPPLSPFHFCHYIDELHLASNNISEIFFDWRSILYLRSLDLRNNSVQSLDIKDMFFSSIKLNVDLSFNQIERISLAEAEQRVEQVSKADRMDIIIFLGNNPIDCNYAIEDLIRYREGRMQPNVYNNFYLNMSNLICQKPSWLMNKPVESLTSTFLTCLKNLENYNITCPLECECCLWPEKQEYLVDCSYKNLKEAPKYLESPGGFTIHLNLTGNSLTKMPSMKENNGYDSVTILSFSENYITEVPLDALSQNLSVLNLHSNNLTRLETPVLEFLKRSTKLKKLTLQMNPWACDCDSKEFFNFVQQKKMDIPELQEVHCEKSDALIFKMTFKEMCPPDNAGSIGIGIGIGVALLGILTGINAVLYYRFQQEIKVWLYAKQWCLWFVTEDELDKDKLYDAFISYSHRDEDFVKDLVARLEQGDEHFKLCVHYRDWLPGDSIPTQIIQSIENSRRTIVVLSPNFLKSVWGKMEFKMAHHQALSDGQARVIIIRYGEIGPIDELDSELKAYLTMNTYVKWGDQWFWEKLNYALPHPLGSIKKTRKQTVFKTRHPTLVTANDKGELIENYQAASTSSANTLKASGSGENGNRNCYINEALIEESI